MRTIKFRAWIPDAKMNKEDMFYQEDQYLSSFIDRIYMKYVVNHPSYLDFDLEERLMQYTGLKDSKGKEIYSGDLLQYKGRLGVIGWHEHTASFDLSFIKYIEGEPHETMKGIPNNEWKFYEVIGNIHENKDLLK